MGLTLRTFLLAPGGLGLGVINGFLVEAGVEGGVSSSLAPSGSISANVASSC